MGGDGARVAFFPWGRREASICGLSAPKADGRILCGLPHDGASDSSGLNLVLELSARLRREESGAATVPERYC